MSKIEWKVGDTGLTRDGRRYEVTAIDSDPDYPIDARIAGDSIERCFTTDGLLWAREDCGEDLMPPTGGVTTLTTEQLQATAEHASAYARYECRERIACAVFAEWAGKAGVGDMHGYRGVAAREAVAWADALIAELEK